jgi:hypothetical protein
MIQPEELRIGNWIQTEGGRPVRVNSIFGDRFNLEFINHEPYSSPLTEMEPIPLTLELLERAGFEKETSEDIEERTIYSIQVANNTSLYFDPHKDWMRDDYEVEWYLTHEWNNNHFKNDFWKRPKYLHQLQNLYFALTGEELNIDL